MQICLNVFAYYFKSFFSIAHVCCSQDLILKFLGTLLPTVSLFSISFLKCCEFSYFEINIFYLWTITKYIVRLLLFQLTVIIKNNKSYHKFSVQFNVCIVNDNLRVKRFSSSKKVIFVTMIKYEKKYLCKKIVSFCFVLMQLNFLLPINVLRTI